MLASAAQRLGIIMYGRDLPPLHLREFDAEVLIEAIEHHLGRLKRTMNEARDRADREGWALAERRRWALHGIWSRVDFELRQLGPMPPEDRESLDDTIRSFGRGMPRSAANAAVLQAETVARREAEAARKAALRAERERHKRFMGLGPED
jgi:hypothetical protein